jgi:hypothetical protein
MLKGFPDDFPNSNGKNEAGLFVRSEVDECPLIKRVKIVEKVVEENESKENHNDNLRHVKFSIAPPAEYLTFPDSEYDRSPLNKPTCTKWKRRLM